jgi:hypothetical protein
VFQGFECRGRQGAGKVVGQVVVVVAGRNMVTDCRMYDLGSCTTNYHTNIQTASH